MSESAKPVAVITGAAGGLGAELVAAFARAGWRVAAGWHTTPIAVANDAVWPVPLDVTQREQVEAAVRSVIERWGRVDALVHNAGNTADQSLARMTESDWDAVLDVHLRGAFLCGRAVLPTMLRQRAGHIIHLGSFAARSGPAGQANYAAAKAGLIGLTTSLAREVGSRNLCVNAVLPGVLPTAMTAGLSAEQLQALAEANALQRLNDPAEVARFVVFLTTLRNVSGQVFQLDSRIGRWT